MKCVHVLRVKLLSSLGYNIRMLHLHVLYSVSSDHSHKRRYFYSLTRELIKITAKDKGMNSLF